MKELIKDFLTGAMVILPVALGTILIVLFPLLVEVVLIAILSVIVLTILGSVLRGGK